MILTLRENKHIKGTHRETIISRQLCTLKRRARKVHHSGLHNMFIQWSLKVNLILKKRTKFWTIRIFCMLLLQCQKRINSSKRRGIWTLCLKSNLQGRWWVHTGRKNLWENLYQATKIIGLLWTTSIRCSSKRRSPISLRQCIYPHNLPMKTSFRTIVLNFKLFNLHKSKGFKAQKKQFI
jgi:hypothetical protein